MNWASEGLKISKTFWVIVVLEAGASQNTGSCMPPTLKMPYHNIHGKVHYSPQVFYINFTMVKVEEVYLKV